MGSVWELKKKALKPHLSVQSHSIRACESIFIIFFIVLLFIIFAPSSVNFRSKIAPNAVICMIFFYVFLDIGVMTTQKRRILSFVFTVTFIILFRYITVYISTTVAYAPY